MIRDLEYPDDARKVINELHERLKYDAAISVLGLASAKLELKEGTQPDFSTGIRYGGRIEDEAVRRDAAGLLSRFSLISMVSHIEQHAQLLLLQRRVIEEMVSTGQRLDSKSMWKILRGVHKIPSVGL